MIAIHGYFLWRVRDRIARADPDFTVYYTAGKMLRQGRGAQLYQAPAQLATQAEFARDSDIRRGPLPYIHPPFEALYFLPLTFFPYSQAFVVWSLVNIALLAGVAALLRTSLPSLRAIPTWQAVLACLAFFPIFANFHQGQDAILLLLFLGLGFRALDRGADFLGGCWLGLGVFKYHLILPLALILTVWKGRRFLFGFAATASAGVLISLSLVGWKGALQYPAFAWQVVSNPGLGGIPPRQLPDLWGLLAGWPVSEKMIPFLRLAAAAGSGAVLLAVASLRKAVTDPRLFRLSFACAVIAAVLVGFSTNTYDLSLLIAPLALVENHRLSESRGQMLWNRSLIVPAIPLLISPLWFFLWMRWQRTNLMALSLLCWLYVIWREVRRLRSQSEQALPSAGLLANV